MSESINPLKLVKVVDSRLSAGRSVEYGIEQGPSSIIYKSYPSSNLSSSNVIFNNINPNNSMTYVDRTVFVQLQFQVNFVGTCPAGQNILDQYGYDVAPRCMPINNSFKSLTVTINGSSFSQDQNDLLPVFSRVHFEKLKSFLSQSCSVPDNCQLYSEGVGANANVLASTQTMPPLYGDYTRGGFEGVQVLTNTPTSGSLLLTATEPLIISPLNYDDVSGTRPFFYNMSTFQVQATFDTQLAQRLMSVSNNSTATFTSISAVPTFSNVFIGEYTSMPNQMKPSVVSYPWHPTTRFIQAGQPLAPQASTTLYMNNIQLNSVPKKLYLYVKPTRSSYNVSQTDTFARIDGVSITMGNKSALLSGVPSNTLYTISKRNGVDTDWSSWHGSTNAKPRNFSGVGSVLALSPCKDLGLADFLTAGSSTTIQVQFQVSYTNIQPLGTPSVAYDCYLVTVDDGLITLPGAGVCLQQSSVVSPTDLLTASTLEPKYTTADVMDYDGGNFFTSIRDFIKSPPQWAKTAWDVTKRVAPLVAPLIGLGSSGGAYSGGADSGGGLVGGKAISKKKLLQLMR